MVTHIAETIQAGTTTELNFGSAFAPVTGAGATETIDWNEVDGTASAGNVSVPFPNGPQPLTLSGPVIAITVAPGPADVGETFSIDVTITATVGDVSIPSDFSLDYTITAGSSPPIGLPGIPQVPTNASMDQISPGVIQSGDYHVNSDDSWYIDNRTPSSGDDPSYYSG